MAGFATRQRSIERKLAKKHLSKGSPPYVVSSS